MGTTLTGTTPQDTYDSLIKVTDNGPLSGSLKTLTDGLGNDSALALSTGAASVTGTLAVSGNAAFDTNTLFVDAAANEVGIGTTAPSSKLHLSGASTIFQVTDSNKLTNNSLHISAISQTAWGIGTDVSGTFSGTKLAITDAGNVGIGTSAPQAKLDVTKAGKATIAVLDNTAFAAGVGGSIDLGGNYRTTGDFGTFTRIAAEKSNATDGNFGFDLGFYVTTNGGSTLGTKVATMTADAYLRLAASTGGIQFNGDTAAANALDDYEEGTWTPTDGSGAGLTITNNGSRYTKIGNVVNISLDITYPSTANASDMAIIGVPFTIAADGGASVGYTTFAPAIQTFVQTSSSINGFRLQNGGGGTISNATMSTVRIQISATYFV